MLDESLFQDLISLTETLNSSRSIEVGNNATEVYKGVRDVLVSGNLIEVVTGDRNLTVHNSNIETYKNIRNIVVSGNKTVNIDGLYNLTIDGQSSSLCKGNLTRTIEGTFTETVTGAVTNVYGSPDVGFVSGDVEAFKKVGLYSEVTVNRGTENVGSEVGKHEIGRAKSRGIEHNSGSASGVFMSSASLKTTTYKHYLFDVDQ